MEKDNLNSAAKAYSDTYSITSDNKSTSLPINGDNLSFTENAMNGEKNCMLNDIYKERDVKENAFGNIQDINNNTYKTPLKKNNSIKSKFRSSNKYSYNYNKTTKIKEEPSKKSRCPSIWIIYCNIVTFYAPAFILKRIGFSQKDQRTAWREKIGLVSIILLMCGIVGFLTFGLQSVLCKSNIRIQRSLLKNKYIVVRGYAYDVSQFGHPASDLTGPDRASIIGAPLNAGKTDLTLLFQNAEASCKEILIYTSDFKSPNDNNANVFPCQIMPFEAANPPNSTVEIEACHNSKSSLEMLLNLPSIPISYSWEEVKNNPDYVIYNGAVLDLNRIDWFLPGIQIPNEILNLKSQRSSNVDTSLYINSLPQAQIGKCVSDLFTVGFIDTTSLGCITSSIMLYAALLVILGAVFTKFFMAVYFGWFMSRRLGITKSETKEQRLQRLDEIEKWTDLNNHHVKENIVSKYSVQNNTNNQYGQNKSRMKSFLPTTSRYSSFMPGDLPKFRESYNRKSSNFSNKNYRSLKGISAYNTSFHSYSTIRPPTRNNGHASVNIASEVAYYQSTKKVSSGILDLKSQSEKNKIINNLNFEPLHTFLLVTCYSEGSAGIRTTLDSLVSTDYPSDHKCLIVICDGLIKGEGEELTTPDICLSMMRDFAIPPDRIKAYSYVAVASGVKRHNMAKVYCGFYAPNQNSPDSAQNSRVPMILIVKCGIESEKGDKKPGNRGKRDSQVILMSFLQRVMFDERLSQVEYQMFNGIWSITGTPPDKFEIVLMVDADTKIYPDSLSHMVSVMANDYMVMGLCGETKIANKKDSFTSMIQVFEYYIAHHQSKAFESVFGGVTCLPGCFCMYRIKAKKGFSGYWVPILANPTVVESYAENVVDTLHKKNLLLLGEDRYLSTLMLKNFPKRKMTFVPSAVCKTIVPNEFKVLLSQRRRWINSTVHNLMELMFVRDLCGTFCFSMQFIIFMELVGTLVLPAAISFTIYLIVISFFVTPVPWIPLFLLAIILGLPAVLIGLTSRKLVYVGWMAIYLLSIVVWNFILPTYSYWHFDDFSWGETRKVQGELKEKDHDTTGEFDSKMITMKRWCEFELDQQNIILELLKNKTELVKILAMSSYENENNYNSQNGIGQVSALVDSLIDEGKVDLLNHILEIEKRGYTPPFNLTIISNQYLEREMRYQKEGKYNDGYNE
ncbi:hypothetical protein BB561_005510 [Smittium simulii]|uniref:chitin synthase n=1 Tax=Smittium simulii TaxID=133385 RepID=A0A2T9Y9Z3_9FUNG|nr:hypothetical protein BB561_005510 [Smittium simulii]